MFNFCQENPFDSLIPSLTVIINTSVLSLFDVIKHANKTKNIFYHS